MEAALGILSHEEIMRVGEAAAALSIRKIRLTGDTHLRAARDRKIHGSQTS